MRLLQVTTILCFLHLTAAQDSTSTSRSRQSNHVSVSIASLPITRGRAFASTQRGPQFSSTSFGSGSTNGVVTASVSTRRPPTPTPSLPPFPVDFTTSEASLRTYIFQSNIAGATRVLRSQRIISLGAGLTHPPQLAALVEPSQERNQDPDVVAFKALAKSALETGEASKLATVVMLSFQPDCECRAGSADELDDVRLEFEKAFLDRAAMTEVVNADANLELTRKLLQNGKSPVHSFVCSACWPKKHCKHLNWC